MSDTDESPAQRAARLRRERREAKIKAGGSARLEKITSLSGRPATSMKDESSPSISPFNSTPEPQLPEPSPSISPLPKPPAVADQSSESVEAQEAYLRALLRSKQPIDQPQDQDPTAALLNSLIGLDSAAPDNRGVVDAAGVPPLDVLSQNLTAAFGVPPSIATFFTQQLQPETPETQKKNRAWQVLHALFACAVGVWLVTMYRTSILTYGAHPPPPATAQSPFVIFLTAELVLNGARLVLNTGNSQLKSVRPWMQTFSSIMRDGRIILFVLGMSSLLRGEA
ncbi:hypothetical protein LOZ39_004268 [Ophidiomyces ophidiicola]|nr:hypothetical protein LOZ64_005104 [Ophidiomyces ophidiicola]KAI2007427.1 hypothetical protein LOZ50_002526 [Ophidiomyces ophidiicola]KAI2009831.1 hypothetical protein LOZ49_003720 [Ophidiomyces ophidiicola]KAI2019479.1 hypothetical protein LOZ46_003303 [Ophidiomyces ophidiicola]KAI2036119.1 hypothetical protein LOZ45_000126 [Ophidiomyces ophidiicola]